MTPRDLGRTPPERNTLYTQLRFPAEAPVAPAGHTMGRDEPFDCHRRRDRPDGNRTDASQGPCSESVILGSRDAERARAAAAEINRLAGGTDCAQGAGNGEAVAASDLV
ncbi:MAG: hypothetical protein ACREYC_21515, partial [Gammaproteobacteria bacterium]